ncbi:hypothetical protein [Roseobacter sp.]|uniref:hypothetical protein n=1 Tax=Roseobacter sp. TaxID=1907202 RepID=UPI0025F64576|nr:hypothetical protein [Roseobacter sp.]
MISATAVTPPVISNAPPAPPVPVETPVPGPGKSTAPGQLAKIAVAEARAAGVELPSNAQGLAASQIAKGADPSALFTLQTTQDAASTDGTQAPGTAGETPASGGTPATDDGASVPAGPEQAAAETAETAMAAALAYQTSAALLAGSGDSSAQVALDLLS